MTKKLTKEKADEARRLYTSTNLKQGQIAKRLGVSRYTINRIITGRIWK